MVLQSSFSIIRFGADGKMMCAGTIIKETEVPDEPHSNLENLRLY